MGAASLPRLHTPNHDRLHAVTHQPPSPPATHWHDAPADWRVDGIALWWHAHAPRQRGEPGAREVLARALGQPPHVLPITRDTQGRPHFIAPLDRLETGWSHSGEVLLVALGEDVELGVDVERIRPRPRAMEIAQRFFHPVEAQWLLSLEEAGREAAFFRLWCAKEAVLKAHGQGISFGLHRLRFETGDDGLRLAECDPGLGRARDWRLHDWSPLPGYHAALAWRPRH